MKSRYFEKVWFSGQNIPYDGDEKTLVQCNIKDGDTLHFFLTQGRHLTLFIRNNVIPHAERNTSYRIVDSTFIFDLKAMLHHSDPDTRNKYQIERLTLQYNGLVLEDDKTLAEYKIPDGAQLYFNVMQQLIFFSMPMYGQMKQILFEPMETVQHMQGKIMYGIQDIFWYPKGAPTHKPIILQGVVRNISGTRSSVYLCLFQTPMTLYVINEGNSSVDQCCYHLTETNTWVEICWLINSAYTAGFKGQIIPKSIQTCANSWMRAFTQEIEASELSPQKAMRLFFFPLTLKVFWLGHVHQSSTIGRALAVACEQSGKIRTKIENYDVCLAHKRYYLVKDYTFFHYRGIFEGKSLGAVGEEHIAVLPRNNVEQSGSINICIRWPSCEPWVWLYLDPEDTIRKLKIAIENTIYVPFYIQRLSYLGRPLENDNCTLGEVGIVPNSHVTVLTISPRAALTSSPIW